MYRYPRIFRYQIFAEKNEQKQAVLAATGGIVGGTTVANVLFKGGITRMNPLMFFGAKLRARRFDASAKMIAGQDVGYFGRVTNISV